MKRNCINYLERISGGSDISTIKRIFNFREKNLSSLKKWLPKKKKLPLDISMYKNYKNNPRDPARRSLKTRSSTSFNLKFLVSLKSAL